MAVISVIAQHERPEQKAPGRWPGFPSTFTHLHGRQLEGKNGRVQTTGSSVSRKGNQDIHSAGAVLVEGRNQRTRAGGRQEGGDQFYVLQRKNERGSEAGK